MRYAINEQILLDMRIQAFREIEANVRRNRRESMEWLRNTNAIYIDRTRYCGCSGRFRARRRNKG